MSKLLVNCAKDKILVNCDKTKILITCPPPNCCKSGNHCWSDRCTLRVIVSGDPNDNYEAVVSPDAPFSDSIIYTPYAMNMGGGCAPLENAHIWNDLGTGQTPVAYCPYPSYGFAGLNGVMPVGDAVLPDYNLLWLLMRPDLTFDMGAPMLNNPASTWDGTSPLTAGVSGLEYTDSTLQLLHLKNFDLSVEIINNKCCQCGGSGDCVPTADNTRATGDGDCTEAQGTDCPA